MPPTVYVALLNYNGWRDTIECLESLMRCDYTDLRVLVLDNGSTDGSLARLRAWATGTDQPVPTSSPTLSHLTTPPIPKPVRFSDTTRAELEQGRGVDWTHGKLALVDNGANVGFAAGNNVAFRYMTSREPDSYLLMLNNDTVIARDAIAEMVAFSRRENDGVAVGATLLQYHHPERVETLGGASVAPWNGHSRLIQWGSPRSQARGQPAHMDFLSGCCMLIPHQVLKRVGEMDERFFLYSEDADWGLRVRSAGLRLAYAPRAEVWHKGGATAVHRSAFHDYHNVKSVLHFVRKHRPLMLPLAALYLGARAGAPKVLRREWKRLRAVVRGYADFLRELSRA